MSAPRRHLPEGWVGSHAGGATAGPTRTAGPADSLLDNLDVGTAAADVGPGAEGAVEGWVVVDGEGGGGGEEGEVGSLPSTHAPPRQRRGLGGSLAALARSLKARVSPITRRRDGGGSGSGGARASSRGKGTAGNVQSTSRSNLTAATRGGGGGGGAMASGVARSHTQRFARMREPAKAAAERERGRLRFRFDKLLALYAEAPAAKLVLQRGALEQSVR